MKKQERSKKTLVILLLIAALSCINFSETVYALAQEAPLVCEIRRCNITPTDVNFRCIVQVAGVCISWTYDWHGTTTCSGDEENGSSTEEWNSTSVLTCHRL